MSIATKGRPRPARENLTDPIADMLARIRNGLLRHHGTVRCRASQKKKRILDVLVNEGYLRSVVEVDGPTGLKELEIGLKYYEGEPVIRELQRISKPGRRSYFASKDLPEVRNGLGVAVVSTNRGVMSDAKARELNVGGELLCTVF
ncbi:MAG: 30S ribosomal protein S8 [Pseudomonadota bacterium]